MFTYIQTGRHNVIPGNMSFPKRNTYVVIDKKDKYGYQMKIFVTVT